MRHDLATCLVESWPAPDVTTEDLLVPGVDQDIPARLHRPTAPPAPGGRPLVVAFPAGGWVDRCAGAWARLCRQVAATVGAVVAEVGYRQGPAHPAPVPHHDAYAATVWLAEHADRLEAGAGSLVLLGEGLGGTLAATVALDARQRGRPAIAFQALLYPATDLTLASPSVVEHAGGPGLTGAELRRYVAAHLGDLADPLDPLVSPLHADVHAGLPAAWVLTAEHDPLRDDGLRYAAALRSAGVPVEHVEVPGSAHGFVSGPAPGRDTPDVALAALGAAIRRAVLPNDAAVQTPPDGFVSAADPRHARPSAVGPPTTRT